MTPSPGVELAWTERPWDPQPFIQVRSDDQRFLVITWDGRVLESADGLAWTPVGTIELAPWDVSGAAAYKGGYVAVGEGGDQSNVGGPIWFSRDAASWEWVGDDPAFAADADGVPSPDGSAPLISSVLRAPGGLVAVGEIRCWCTASVVPRPAIWLSPTGRQWERVTSGALEPRSLPGLRSVIEGHGELVAQAGARRDEVWTSTDGRTWTPAVQALEIDRIVTTTNGYLGLRSARPIGGGPDNAVFVSSDLEEWDQIEQVDFEGGWIADATSGDVTVVVTHFWDRPPGVWWSADGRSWGHEDLPTGPVAAVAAVAIDGRRVAIVVDEESGDRTLWVRDLPTP